MKEIRINRKLIIEEIINIFYLNNELIKHTELENNITSKTSSILCNILDINDKAHKNFILNYKTKLVNENDDEKELRRMLILDKNGKLL